MAGPFKVRVIFAFISAFHEQDIRSGWIFNLRKARVGRKGWGVLEDRSLAIPLEILPLKLWKP
jgi:hypothetical protein